MSMSELSDVNWQDNKRTLALKGFELYSLHFLPLLLWFLSSTKSGFFLNMTKFSMKGVSLRYSSLASSALSPCPISTGVSWV